MYDANIERYSVTYRLTRTDDAPAMEYLTDGDQDVVSMQSASILCSAMGKQLAQTHGTLLRAVRTVNSSHKRPTYIYDTMLYNTIQ